MEPNSGGGEAKQNFGTKHWKTWLKLEIAVHAGGKKLAPKIGKH